MITDARTIYRVACRHKPYSQIGNAMLRDTRLSIEARGALAMMLSYPSNWQVTSTWLCQMAGVGRDKARAILGELEQFGYCIRARLRKKDGQLGQVEYLFTDEPAAIADATAPGPENPSVEEARPWKPGPGQPGPENPTPSKEGTSPKKVITNTPTPHGAGGGDEDFENFWRSYPKGKHAHVKKVAAQEAFEAAARSGEVTAGDLIVAARTFAASRPDPAYVPMALTWLKAERWKDEPQPAGSAVVQFSAGLTVRDTSEPWAEYKARMIREGKIKPVGAPQ
jgi:hypothetical protein